MNELLLQQQLKSSGTAYLLWFLLGAHYAYLGKWGIQIIYWITFGGFGIWALIDLFTISSKINKHNNIILKKLEKIKN